MRYLALCVALAGCGSAAELKPRAGAAPPPPPPGPPPAPVGATATPAARDLMTPTAQQRPQTVDELLTRSERRRSDEFDLPPGAAPANATDRPE